MKFRNFRVGLKLGLFLMALVVVLVVNYIGVSYFLSVQKDDAAVIDASGRNRMLSQRISFLCERVMRGQYVHAELKGAIDLLDSSLDALKWGGIAPGIANDQVLPPTQGVNRAQLDVAAAQWVEFRRNAMTILAGPMEVDSVYNAEGPDGAVIRVPIQIPNQFVTRAMKYVEANSSTLVSRFDTLTKAYVADSLRNKASLQVAIICLLILGIAFIALAFYVINRVVVAPVRLISDVSAALSRGNLSVACTYQSNDEIGTAISGLEVLSKNLKSAAGFADDIGNGRFASDFKPVGEDDKLGQALVTMRDKLAQVAEEDQRRNWVREGLAHITELIQSHRNDLSKMGDAILSALIKHLEANQGAVFIVDNEDGKPCLKLLSMYAWSKKRFVNKILHPGEGLAGQVWLEKQIVYVRETPDTFMEITSGIGKAMPRSLVVVPLMVDGEVFGVLEIASFREYEPFERDFLLKVSEHVASALSVTKVNERTKLLLEQSLQQAEELRAQEEEMKQNMEEMQATQEEITRKEREYMRVNAQMHDELQAQKRLVETLERKLAEQAERGEVERIIIASGGKASEVAGVNVVNHRQETTQ